MLDLGGLRKHWRVDREDHFVIVLWEKPERETSYREHKVPCINVTKSGIDLKYTVERLIYFEEKDG